MKELIMELESHEHYEMLEDSFEKLKLGCLSFSKYWPPFW
jgi:hypothetical protein